MKKLAKSLACASALSLLSLSASTAFAPAQAFDVYTKAGILGAGIGASLGITDNFSVRGDFTTAGSYKRDFAINQLNYHVRMKTEHWSAYGDWFPFSDGLRLTGGLQVRHLQAQAWAQPTQSDSINIGFIEVPYGPEDSVGGNIKFPTLAPYVGIGWGHHQTQRAGWGMVFDLGVAFGRPQVDLNISDSLRKKLETAARVVEAISGPGSADSSLDIERRDLQNKANHIAVFPHLYLGVSYWF